MLTEWEMVASVAGLTVVSALSRSVFFLSDRPWALPSWAERGLKYAPLAALGAVIFPEILMSHGQWPQTWQDARYAAAPVAMAWAWWRRDMLTTIAVGMAVYLPLKVGLGW